MSDERLRFEERLLSQGDWTAYPRIVAMRARSADLGDFGCYPEWTSGRTIARPRGRLIAIGSNVHYRTRDGRFTVSGWHWTRHVAYAVARVTDPLPGIERIPTIGPVLAAILRLTTDPA